MKNVYIAGHNGMVGSAIERLLAKDADVSIVTASRADLNLTCERQVRDFFASQSIDEVYLAAAKVGGILANSTYPVEFLSENLQIQTNVMTQAYEANVKKLMFLGSSCIYPKLANQPISEDQLLTSPLEPTNEAYAIAKIAGLKLCEAYRRQKGADFRAVMPTNLYGPFDRFHLKDSHVIPALMRRIHEAKLADAPEVAIWGSGTPKREFLHVDDMARGSVFAMNLPRSEYDAVAPPESAFLNVGTGQDCTIKELAETLVQVIGYQGELAFDTSKPDGTPRKLLDVDRMRRLGWSAQVGLLEGLEASYSWYLTNIEQANDR